MFKKSKEMVLAIDLAPDAVRIVEVVSRKGSQQVTAMFSEALESGTVENLPERHLATLGKLLAGNRTRTRQCIATVPTNLVVTRSVNIDASKTQPPEEQIRATLQNTLSYDSRDLLFDFWPISEARGNSRSHDVLVVATQGSVVQRYLKGMSKLRLTCAHLDVAPCALASLTARLNPNPETMVGTIVLTETLGYFAVMERERVLFWRPFELSANAKSGLQGSLERVGDEISKCISHMVGSLHLDAMTEIFAFGQGTHEATLTDYLMTRFNLQVKTPSPFESLPADGLGADLRSKLDSHGGTQYATALGLALQTSGGISNG